MNRDLAGAEVAAVDRPALALGVDDVRVVGSTRQTKPSPPLRNIQSSLTGPVLRSVCDGPPQLPLSCSPP